MTGNTQDAEQALELSEGSSKVSKQTSNWTVLNVTEEIELLTHIVN